MRPTLIAGNWKMNPATVAESVALAEAIKVGVGPSADVHVVVCPSFVHLKAVDEVLSGSPIGLAGQDMSGEAAGAFTGQVSGAMLVDIGCTHVVLGHSERRHGQGETDAIVNKKLHAALGVGLLPIVCIGETLAERREGRTLDVIRSQCEGTLAGIGADRLGPVVLAYEPVWAIGTGLTATPDQAQEVHQFLRDLVAGHAGEPAAGRILLLYGGSVKPDNARELLTQPDIDGLLVGGASLKAADFLAILGAGRPA